MSRDLTKGPVMASMLAFAFPMILCNPLQRCYNVADAFIVGRYLGKNALAIVWLNYLIHFFDTSKPESLFRIF